MAINLDKVVTVSQAAAMKGCTRQAVRDAARAEKIKVAVNTAESGYAMLLDRASVEAWQPSSRIGRQHEDRKPSREAALFHAGFVPVSRLVMPSGLPEGRWFQLRDRVWIGLVAPTCFDKSKLSKDARVLFSNDELILIRYSAESVRKRGSA